MLWLLFSHFSANLGQYRGSPAQFRGGFNNFRGNQQQQQQHQPRFQQQQQQQQSPGGWNRGGFTPRGRGGQNVRITLTKYGCKKPQKVAI